MNHKYKIILMGEYTFLLQWWDHRKSSKTIANWTLADIILSPRWNVFILSHPKFLSSMHSDTNPVCWPKPFFFSPLHKKWMLGFPVSRTKKDKHTSRIKLIWKTAQLQPQKRSFKYTNKSKEKLWLLWFSTFSIFVSNVTMRVFKSYIPLPLLLVIQVFFSCYVLNLQRHNNMFLKCAVFAGQKEWKETLIHQTPV